MADSAVGSLILLAVALSPAIVLSAYFFWRFRHYLSVELLAEALGLGVIATLLASGFGLIGMAIAGHFGSSVLISFGEAFLGAAIPEEVAKFILVWMIIRRHEDCEQPQSIFATSIIVGLGFAAIENIAYVFDGSDDWLSVGITRAMMAVPMHTTCGIVMGRFLAQAEAYAARKRWLLTCGVVASIFLHGIYDWPLFYIDWLEEGLPADDPTVLLANLALLAAVTIVSISAILAARHGGATVPDLWQSGVTVSRRIRFVAQGTSMLFGLVGGLLVIVGGLVALMAPLGDVIGFDAPLALTTFGLLPLAFGIIVLRDIQRARAGI